MPVSLPEFVLTPGDRAFVEQAARVAAPVLLVGETGTGKTFLAHRIHERSARAAHPFVPVDCGAVSPSLIETELFGHVKGAFTDAARDRAGYVETARGGTLFLDEIHALSRELQSRILTLTAEGWFRKVGSAAVVPADARIIAATNVEIGPAVASGTLREDLVHRLGAFHHCLTPLRERPADIEPLARWILADAEFGKLLGREAGEAAGFELDDSAVRALRKAAFPGNIRQLRNVLLRAAAIMDRGARIRARHVRAALEAGFSFLAGGSRAGAPGTSPPRGRYRAPRDPKEERRAIVQALREEAGHRELAARRLGMSRTTLWNRMRVPGSERRRGSRMVVRWQAICPSEGRNRSKETGPMERLTILTALRFVADSLLHFEAMAGGLLYVMDPRCRWCAQNVPLLNRIHDGGAMPVIGPTFDADPSERFGSR